MTALTNAQRQARWRAKRNRLARSAVSAAKEAERLQELLKAKTTPGYEFLAATIENRDAEIERLTKEKFTLRIRKLRTRYRIEYASSDLPNAWFSFVPTFKTEEQAKLWLLSSGLIGRSI